MPRGNPRWLCNDQCHVSYHIPVHRKEAPPWWCCSHSCWERESWEKRAEGGIWEPAARDQLAGSFFFFSPVKAETTNNHTFLLPELLSLMNTSLQSLCNVNFLNDQKASKLRKCCIFSKRGEGFRGIGNDLLFFKNLGHPLNAVIFKQLVLYICESI